LLRRSAAPGDRPAVFAAQFALSHVGWLLTYLIAGSLGAAFGLSWTATALRLTAAAGLVVALRMWPALDPDILEHEHPELAPDHPHLTSAPARAHGRHAHAFVIDDAHRSGRGRVSAGRTNRPLPAYAIDRRRASRENRLIGRLGGNLCRLTAMMCVAICCLVAVQVSVSTVDSVHHALELDHAPNPLAGAVDLDHHGDDDSGDQTEPDGQGAQPHQHLSDGPAAPSPGSPSLSDRGLEHTAKVDAPPAAMPPGAKLLALERPPKAALEV